MSVSFRALGSAAISISLASSAPVLASAQDTGGELAPLSAAEWDSAPPLELAPRYPRFDTIPSSRELRLAPRFRFSRPRPTIAPSPLGSFALAYDEVLVWESPRGLRFVLSERIADSMNAGFVPIPGVFSLDGTTRRISLRVDTPRGFTLFVEMSSLEPDCPPNGRCVEAERYWGFGVMLPPSRRILLPWRRRRRRGRRRSGARVGFGFFGGPRSPTSLGLLVRW